MVTRKAITTAFEAITNDPAVKSVTVFIHQRPLVSTFKMCRVRVTRIGKGRNASTYIVSLGRMNYAERAYVGRCISKTHKTPTIWIRLYPTKKKA